MTDPHDAFPDTGRIDELIKSSLDFPVVGLGASAGGLQVLLGFFERMPATSGMAFVVILHLSPDHESNVAEILQRVTRMPVVQVNAPTGIEANHVYVIAPSHDLSMNDGQLVLSDPVRARGAHLAIDLFFRTLAEVHQERAIAIVLSGTGTDGAAGLARVKGEGGLTMVQSPEEAEYDGMPSAAIATGMVDFVLKAADMLQRLVDLWANASRISLPQNSEIPIQAPQAEIDAAVRLDEEALREIVALLRTHSKNDFRQYKRATVLRRIERRMQVNSMPDLTAYLAFLRAHPEEAKPLMQDMLISVTNFFRDPKAFEALEQEVLFYARQNLQDMLTQQAVCTNGYLALDVLKKTGREMMNGCSRIATTGMSALAVAQTVARATGNQIKVMDMLTGVNSTIEGLIQETGRQLNTHVDKTAQFSQDPMIGMDKLKDMFDQTFKAMDAMDTFRSKAIEVMGQNNDMIKQQLAKADQYVDRQRQQQAREATRQASNGPVAL